MREHGLALVRGQYKVDVNGLPHLVTNWNLMRPRLRPELITAKDQAENLVRRAMQSITHRCEFQAGTFVYATEVQTCKPGCKEM